MGWYILRRAGQAVLVIWAAFTATFLILNLLPGDTVALQLAANNIDIDSLSPQERLVEAARFGLDRPLWEQYLSLLSGALVGDFGVSFQEKAPVIDVLAARLPGTLTLAGAAIALSLTLGVAAAYFTTWLPRGRLSNALRRVPAAIVSVPNFWIGLVLIQIFAFTLGWLPAIGDKTPAALILPAVTMAIPTSAFLTQILIRSFDDTTQQPYIATARAKGLSHSAVHFTHAFRNAALPTLTILGLMIGNTVSGAVIVETLFSRNGVGLLAQQAVNNQDIPVVQAIVTLAAVAFVLSNLLVDLLYPLLDPRISHTPKVSRA